MLHVLYHHLLTNCCAGHRVYQLAWSFPLLHVASSMDTRCQESPGPTIISSRHVGRLQTLCSFLLKVPSAPPAKMWQTNPLSNDLMEWEVAAQVVFTMTTSTFLVVCKKLIVYVNLLVSALISWCRIISRCIIKMFIYFSVISQWNLF